MIVLDNNRSINSPLSGALTKIDTDDKIAVL